MANHTGHWLTLKRLRAHGAIVALCLWSYYLWTIATPGLLDRNGKLKGTDFLHLYTLGSLAAAHRGADLYDINAQAALAAQRVPEAAGIRYLPLYPPQVSIFFAPLSHLSYGWALILWWGLSGVIYAICCYGVWRLCPNLREYCGTLVLLALAFPAFFHLIAWGQTSAIALACFTGMFFLLRDHRQFLAGLVLGCLIFKPQLALAAIIVFISIGAWKVPLQELLSQRRRSSPSEPSTMERNRCASGCACCGTRAPLPLLEPKPYQTHSLRTFWSMLVPWPALSLTLYVRQRGRRACSHHRLLEAQLRCAAVATLFGAATGNRSSVAASHGLRLGDLAPAIILLADWLAGQALAPSTRWLGTLLYLVYMLPLLGPFARWTHLQLSVLAMAATLFLIWRISCGSTSPGFARDRENSAQT
jgi:hypothetical protein